jgi:hypothetical protein
MNSFLKGFLSIFDWMFPKSLEEQFEDLDNSMQNLYDRMGWGKYKAYPTTEAFNMATDIALTMEPSTQTIYASKETINQLLLDMNKNVKTDIKLTKDQEFAIWWLYDREAGRFPDKDTIIVNGINITEIIRELLKDRLFV